MGLFKQGARSCRLPEESKRIISSRNKKIGFPFEGGLFFYCEKALTKLNRILTINVAHIDTLSA
ncbi:hypothetical protein AGMMS49574_04380 [Bacteroidia bacterium]|nr:hypothetical protein AGMMS49574_04380 [Bacteroidia bacterium]